MTLMNKSPNLKLHHPALNRHIVSTDGTRTSVLPIAVGLDVFTSDGHLGWITHMLRNTDGRIGAFVIRTRGWWRRKLIVPLDYIDSMDEEKVYLSVSKIELKKLPTYRPDHVLVGLVLQALWEDTIFRRTEYRRIHVEVENGIAYLSGYVSSPAMSAGAEKAAYKSGGIWNVVNHLAIDSDMQLAVSQAIGKDAHIRNAKILVGVNNGFVTLTGQTPNLAGRSAAQEQAAAIPKVRGVLNSIRVPGVDIEVEDLRALQPAIGAGIYATDIPIGAVEKVVVNQENRLVTAILANVVFPDPDQTGSNWLRNEHRYVERRIVIPIASVRHQTSTSIFLREKSDVVAGSPDFAASLYASAPNEWEPPYPYKHEEVVLLRDNRTRGNIR